jgi:hypothetical protein
VQNNQALAEPAGSCGRWITIQSKLDRSSIRWWLVSRAHSSQWSVPHQDPVYVRLFLVHVGAHLGRPAITSSVERPVSQVFYSLRMRRLPRDALSSHSWSGCAGLLCKRRALDQQSPKYGMRMLRKRLTPLIGKPRTVNRFEEQRRGLTTDPQSGFALQRKASGNDCASSHGKNLDEQQEGERIWSHPSENSTISLAGYPKGPSRFSKTIAAVQCLPINSSSRRTRTIDEPTFLSFEEYSTAGTDQTIEQGQQ